jgi:hypothetical protein
MARHGETDGTAESNGLETTKRNFMRLLGATGAGVGLGGASAATDSGVVAALDADDSGKVKNVYTAHTKEGLPDLSVDETPAVGITDWGVYGYDVSADRWEQFTDEPIQNVRENDVDYGLVDRPLQSTQSRTLHVAPDGSDDGAGTEDDPFATVQEAFNRTPTFIYHPWTIDMADGEYLSGKDVFATRTGLHLVWAGDNFTLLGNTDNPENVTINALNAKFFGKLEDIQFEGFSVKYLSQFAGPAFARNCRFLGKTYREAATSALSGKNGNVDLTWCQVGNREDPPDYAIQHSFYDNYLLRGCSVYAKDYAVDNSYHKQARVQMARNSSWEAGYGLSDTGAGVRAEDNRSIDTGSSTLFIYDQTAYIGDGVTVCDDFGDNRLRDRLTMNGGFHGGYRPEWSLVESAYASGGELVLSASDGRADIPSPVGVGTWDFDVAIGGDKPGRGPPDHVPPQARNDSTRGPSAGEFSAFFLRANGGEDAYWLRFAADGTLALVKRESGTTTVLGTGSWSGSGRHFVRVTRNKDGAMVVSVDGSEEITATDGFQPRVSDEHAVRFDNGFDIGVRLDNLRIRQNAIDTTSEAVIATPEDEEEDD